MRHGVARHARHALRTRRNWDFALMMTTIALLGGLGLQSFAGTLYSWWAYRTQPGWDATGYAAFVATMNAIAAPLLLGLVIVMGLCVPKRLFSHRSLVAASAAMVAFGVVVGAVSGRPATGLAAYLAAAGLIQVAVVVLTVAGTGELSYLRDGRLVKMGSGLLHLGFIVFAFTVVALQRSPLMLPVFWTATGLAIGGSVLSFYARPLPESSPGEAAPSAEEPAP